MSQIKKVSNWTDYNKSLVKRGEIIFNISEEFSQKLYYEGAQKRGGFRKYSREMFEFILYIKVLLRFPIRAAIGFATGILSKIFGNKEFKMPNYAHASREINKLDLKIQNHVKPGESIALCFDSTGIKIYSSSDWHQRKYSKSEASSCEKWIKVHIAQDLDSGQILSYEVTSSTTNDCEVIEKLIDKLELDNEIKVESIRGDGAYDTYKMYEIGHQLGAKVLIPPSATSKAQDELSAQTKINNIRRKGKKLDYLKQRDETIKYIRQYETFEEGLKKWKESSKYHERSRVEATMHRIKRTFGFCTQFKLEKSRCNEITIKMNVLNRMLLLGKAEYHEGVFQKGDKLPKKTSETSKKLDQNALNSVISVIGCEKFECVM